MVDQRVIVLYVPKGGHQSLLPGGGALKGFGGLMLQKPVEQIIDILKMIVEGLPVDLAVLHNLLDGDIVQKFLLEQAFKRVGQCELGAGGQ